MAKIVGFRAIRPTRDKVHLVATRPYYTYKSNVLKAKLEDNPFTFLHIINPEFGKANKTKPNSNERFLHVKEQFNRFLDEGILKQDKEDILYIYRQTKGDFSCIGVIAGSSIAEYDAGQIKKHEATLTSREEMFTRYLEIVGFNAEPVLLTYQNNDDIAQFLRKKTNDRPEYEFSTTDKVKHELWCLATTESDDLIQKFSSIDATYIADGHHRSASSARLHHLRDKESMNSSTSYFLSFLVQENQIEIIEFNRLVKTLNHLSEEEFLLKLSMVGELIPMNEIRNPSKEHEIVVVLKNKAFSFFPLPKFIDLHHPVNSLDPEILTQLILSPILGIHDLKTSEELVFSPGIESIDSVVEKINSEKYAVGFLLYPLSIQQVKRVADNGMNMPPKSTWVEPKLRSGLTIYPID
ncbi:MAG TPA: DUF1015 domain-containing protein [Crocinitomicaceae bacterium]|nr:DUF1015 domain-containing protein [Flavobacteriales bacterium]HBW86448.1 DUF1015 domain-containing protein [Crocinitomicaceae bacterium]